MRTAPCACFARRPVSKVNGLPLMRTDSRTNAMGTSAPSARTAAACGETPGVLGGPSFPRFAGVSALARTNRRARRRGRRSETRELRRLLAKVEGDDDLAVAVEAR